MRKIFLVAAIALVGMQFIPIERSNPSARSDVPAPPQIEAIFRRACYDCHSNETHWPWYSWVAPISFLLSHDVKEGRQELNFSIWSRYDERHRARKLREILKQVESGEMPPWYYIRMHPDAGLSSAERGAVLGWAKEPAEPGGNVSALLGHMK